MVCSVGNLGHILKPSSHLASLENIWFSGSYFENVDARWGHTIKLYYRIYLDALYTESGRMNIAHWIYSRVQHDLAQ